MLICLVVCSEGLQAEALFSVDVKQSAFGQRRPVLGSSGHAIPRSLALWRLRQNPRLQILEANRVGRLPEQSTSRVAEGPDLRGIATAVSTLEEVKPHGQASADARLRQLIR